MQSLEVALLRVSEKTLKYIVVSIRRRAHVTCTIRYLVSTTVTPERGSQKSVRDSAVTKPTSR